MNIDILGVLYKVKLVNLTSRRKALLGEIDYVKQEIRIDKKLKKERKREVLLHEIIHGLTEAVGLDEKLTEQDIQSLARAIYALFRSNRPIFSLMAFEKEQNRQRI